MLSINEEQELLNKKVEDLKKQKNTIWKVFDIFILELEALALVAKTSNEYVKINDIQAKKIKVNALF
jgi:hypothetical protein